MVIPFRRSALTTRLKGLLTSQRFNHSVVEVEPQARTSAGTGSNLVHKQGQIDFSKWRMVDSRTVGLTQSMISESSWIVLKILQSKGFEAYLVGGCVRDLLLNKIPKDFDVITTAALEKVLCHCFKFFDSPVSFYKGRTGCKSKLTVVLLGHKLQIKKQFHRSEIVGRRFPICRVHVKGSVIEVSSFETLAQNSERKEKYLVSKMPKGCEELDLLRWKNSMRRDFTINSLFFNPFLNKIYDYANGMVDLRSLKLRTLVPAQLSFKEDRARILRGLRIAARLGLSFTKETERAIHEFSPSLLNFSKSRIMMELNSMLSYGAAEPSLCLLQRFNLLEILLPFHAAYLAQHSKDSDQSSTMLMVTFVSEIFFSLYCGTWARVGLLAFHLALVNYPQHRLVVLAFASVLYHGKWKQGVEVARQHTQAQFRFVPEISEADDYISDDVLAEKVAELTLLVQDSVNILTDTDSLLQTMERFPGFPCPGLVFVSKNKGKDAGELFNVLVHNAESHTVERKNFEIDYHLLGEGNACEERFVLGKIIMDTMGCVVQGSEITEEEKDNLHASDPVEMVGFIEEVGSEKRHAVGRVDRRRIVSSSKLKQDSAQNQKLIYKTSRFSDCGVIKKQQNIINGKPEEMVEKDQNLVENKNDYELAKIDENVIRFEDSCLSQHYSAETPEGKIITMQEDEIKKGERQLEQQEITRKNKKLAGKEKHWERVEKPSKVVEQIKCLLSPDDARKLLKTVEKLSEDNIKITRSHLHLHKVVREEEEQQQIAVETGSRLPLSSLFK
ncbi:hypothetical protein RJ639_013291 [Escallonia herrerae]|uniref:Uncharacterized protein n=1 Tax=Escallonia herrerae TaxID=1293975 RepID=A0AA89AMV5_9ASTE|nr:hypothetical protein RJ639_013291 [Escallonia herrerae]